MALGNNIKKDKLISPDKVSNNVSIQNPTETDLYIDSFLYEVLDGCVDAVICINAKGIISFFNVTAENLWGYSRQEVIGENVKILMGGEDEIKHDDYIKNYLTTGKAKVIGSGREVEAKTKDGTFIPILLTLSEAKKDGESFFTAFIKDLKEHKKQEEIASKNLEKMKANEEVLKKNMTSLMTSQQELKNKQHQILKIVNKYEQILEGCSDSVIIMDDKGIISFFNKTAEKFWGYHREEILGRHIRLLLPEKYQALFNDDFGNKDTLDGDKLVGVDKELEIITNDNLLIPSLLTLSEAKTDEGSVYTAFIKDITEKKKMEHEAMLQMEAIQASEEELRQNMEELQATQETQAKMSAEMAGQLRAINNSIAYIEFDPDGNIVNANDIFLKTMAYNLDEILGKHHRIFVDPQYGGTKSYANFWKELKEGQTKSGLYQRINKNGKDVWLDGSYAPILNENNEVIKIIKLAKDVTDFNFALKKTSDFLGEIQNGNFDVDFDIGDTQIEGDLGKMIMANIALRDNLKFIINEVNRVVNLAGNEGILSERLKPENMSGAWKDLVDSLNILLESISVPILEINKIVTNLSMGDLTQRLEIAASGDIADMANALNIALNNLNALIKQIEENKLVLTPSSQDLQNKSISMRKNTAESSAAIQQMADGAQEQAARTDESSRLVEETLKSSNEVNQKAEIIHLSAEKGQQNCKRGLEIVESVVTNMNDIAGSASVTAQSIEILTSRSEEISRILNIITDIASQTKLLALNAAIEAARAGDAGRSFAVVAEEIRKLSEDSRKSTVEIDKLIKDIQRDISSTGKAIEKMQSSVASGNEATQKTSAVFNDINEVSTETLVLSKQIVKSSQIQKDAISLVVKNIEKIVVVSEETASGTQQIASSSRELDKTMIEVSQTSEDLSAIADSLKKQIGTFKVKADGNQQ